MAPQHRGDEGFSLVEVVVAFAVFALLATAAVAVLTHSLGLARSNEGRVVAANLAARQIEIARGTPPKDIPDGVTTKAMSVDGRSYTVQQSTAYDTAGGTANFCEGATGPIAVKRVDVTVTWPNMVGAQPVHSDTFVSLPIGGLDTTTGILTVPVRNAANQPVAGVTVTLGGPASASAVTGTDGCVVFTALAPASNYTVTASRSANDYVDPSGNHNPTRGSITVTAGTVTKDAGFLYDEAATLALTIPTPAGYPLPAAGSGAMSIGVSLGSSLFPGGIRGYPCGSTTCGTSGSPYVVRDLYPDPNGYSVWPGTCSADGKPASPPGWTPGQTQPVSTAPTGGILVTQSSSGSFRNQTVYAVHKTATDCTAGREVYRFPTLLNPGGQIKLAVPAGTWRIVTNPANADTSGAYVEVTVTSGQVATVNL